MQSGANRKAKENSKRVLFYLSRDGEAVSRMPHKHKIVGANPTLGTKSRLEKTS